MTDGFLGVALAIAMALQLAGMALAFVRLAIGPTGPDRVVALDMMAVLMVGFAALFALASDEAAFLDIGIALALVAFLGTVALARYVESRAREESERAAGASHEPEDAS
jgi:multicomponent Na+:H+ antiporter subunit F